MDIYPCTVDDKTWDQDVSMKVLFGRLCSEQIFAHDKDMIKAVEARDSTTVTKWHAHQRPSSDPKEGKYTSTPKSIGTSSRVASDELSSPVYKKPRTTSCNGIKPVQSLSKAPPIETNSSTATSGEKRVRAIKASFELESSKDRGFPFTKSRGALVGHTESPTKTKNSFVQQYEHVASQPVASFNEPVELYNESPPPSSRSSEQAKSLDIPLQEIADTDLREQVREIQHKVGCSAIMARTFANIHCLQSVKDFFNQESEAAAYRSTFDSGSTALTDRALAAEIVLLRGLFPTADEYYCQRALIRSEGRLEDARDLLASWEESVLERVARNTLKDNDAEADSSTESEQEDSQTTLPDSAFESPQKHTDDKGLQVRSDNTSNRKEAYKAALGKGGREWSTYSPITSSTAAETGDMELK
ncbi:Protein artemis [Xylographa bjoerkii]|nr:Protein artemis [Xylographa bjoerkii]